MIANRDRSETTTKEFNFITGILPYKVVAVNPNLKELEEIGVNYIKNEPEYLTKSNFTNNEQVIITFWVKSTPFDVVKGGNKILTKEGDILTRLDFFIEDTEVAGTISGKKQYINIYGRTAWKLEDGEFDERSNFIEDSVRPALRGEEELYKFFYAWANLKYDTKNNEYDECRLDDIKKVIGGNFSELKSLVSKLKDYQVKILTGLRSTRADDGKTKTNYILYNRYFYKERQFSNENFIKFVEAVDKTGKKINKFNRATLVTFEPTIVSLAEASKSIIEPTPEVKAEQVDF